MTLGDLVFILSMLVVALAATAALASFAISAINVFLTTSAHRDSRERNRHEDVGEVWWRG